MKIDKRELITNLEVDNEINRIAKETMASLNAKIEHKLHTNPCKGLLARASAEPYFIKYTPKVQGPQWNSGAKQRIICLQDVPADPLEPPRNKTTKVPRGPPCPPVRVMHSPPRSADPKEAAYWKIPPAMSNWKNPKGYIIPLDKRIVADGRILQETKINDNFAKLSEALYIAEQKARENIEIRNRMIKELSIRDKEKKEAEIKKLVVKTRSEKNNNKPSPSSKNIPQKNSLSVHLTESYDKEKNYTLYPNNHLDSQKENLYFENYNMKNAENHKNTTRENLLESKKRDERNKIREERRREREKERRIEEAALCGYGYKKSKLKRDLDRDISERVALGITHVHTDSSEVLYDQRLFAQDILFPAGLTTERCHQLYDKAL